MKKPLIILTGPTAVGKTELSIALAQKIGGSVISADSMQVYRRMDIGSAKIRKEEMQGIPHYLVDILEPDEEFHVVRFQEYARRCMEEIQAEGRLPIVAGGTGFYIQALLYDIEFRDEPEDKSYRSWLEQTAREQGAHVLHEMLAEADPESAEAIHENNVKRVIRALEFYHLSGKKISEHNEEERRRESPYQFCYFVLNDDREKLYRRIDLRVDRMVEEGLVEEVRSLKQMGYNRRMVSMQGLGYKEILDYLEGGCTLEEAIYRIKRDTRHFAKRQLTWFRREREVTWIQKQDFDCDNDKILTFMTEELKKKQII
ncbi:tRNA dimethylallyltransferase [Eubacterium sp. 14-2]|uniref:tRNA (adenosine(37)-N6)-dimethylallyltransferase MiaA n=1 Tax=Eubacterium sp. 14-2 TaxID=1235790 RepID=UPI00033ACE5F|nr:tRNA (adenosine(37)-N6)-dimethylallyltransferase MiaA [Eubacterium sp. 14-2]EOT27734.1 tRNA dimethylallyltransferase [Eubacterium sp. 14-2]